ncbi:MAG: amine oxidase [Modestobacter sp.]|nr:amine oxidase [Modestobacter sp.]
MAPRDRRFAQLRGEGRLLGDPTDGERATLGAFTYSTDETVLHTDATPLPTAAAARSSWNYRVTSCTQGVDAVVVSYWMNRLHALDEPVEYLVTLDGDDRVDPDTVLRRMTYEHPLRLPRGRLRLRRPGGPVARVRLVTPLDRAPAIDGPQRDPDWMPVATPAPYDARIGHRRTARTTHTRWRCGGNASAPAGRGSRRPDPGRSPPIGRAADAGSPDRPQVHPIQGPG